MRAIREASERTGVDYEYLVATAHIESGLDPKARAKTSSASGLFQFIESTWLASLDRHANRLGLVGYSSSDTNLITARRLKGSRETLLAMREDPRLAALIAAADTKENASALKRVLGHEASSADLYLAHFLGSAGASRFLRVWARNPEVSAARLFPRAARANRPIFFTRRGQARSLDAVRRLISSKIRRTATLVSAMQQKGHHGPWLEQTTQVSESVVCDPSNALGSGASLQGSARWAARGAGMERNSEAVLAKSAPSQGDLSLNPVHSEKSVIAECVKADTSFPIRAIANKTLTLESGVRGLLTKSRLVSACACDHIGMCYSTPMSTSTITRVRDLVNSGEMTRAGLARAAGLHANTLRDASEADWNPTAETLQKLEVFLNSNDERPVLVGIEEIIDEARNGKMYILVDDEDRENEGDLIIPAQMATPAAINFMATYGRGLICLALDKARVDDLGLEPMSRNNKESMQTAFTISIEAKEGVTTGISAADRARTVSVAIDSTKGADDIVTPGHVFPLAARNGGTLVRAGHTEAAVDISRLAGLNPSGVICEIMNEDGTMARLDDLVEFARLHNLKIGTIRDLIAYRMRNDHLVERLNESSFDSVYGGQWKLLTYKDKVAGNEAYVLQKGHVIEGEPTLSRVHPISVFDDVLGAPGPRQNTLQRSMSAIGERGSGVIVILTSRVGSGEWTSDEEIRNIGIGSQILADLGVNDMILLSNSRPDLVALEGYGISITDFQSIPE